jgi:hypothetical protein
MRKRNLPPWSAKDTTHLSASLHPSSLPSLRALNPRLVDPTSSLGPPAHHRPHQMAQHHRSLGVSITETLHPVKAISQRSHKWSVTFRLGSGRLMHWLSMMMRTIYESWTVRQTYSAIVGFSQSY